MIFSQNMLFRNTHMRARAYTHTHIYIYIYREREREREKTSRFSYLLEYSRLVSDVIYFQCTFFI